MTEQKENCLLFQLLESLFGKSFEQTTDASREPANTDQAISHSSQVQINSDDRSAEESANAMNTQRSDRPRRRRRIPNLIPFFDRTEPSISWIGNMVALAVFFAGVVKFVDIRINQVFDQKITPYQELIRGMTLVESEDHDKSIVYLEKAFRALTKDLKEHEPIEDYHSPVVDYYLEAIANSSKPKNHIPRFKQILKLEEEGKYAFSGWHYNEIGWIHLRTGKLDEARQRFQQAVEEHEDDQFFTEAGHSYWALTLTSLCVGDIETALSYYEEARRRSYIYSPDVILIDLRYMDESDWYSLLVRRYDIEEAVDAFIKRIENLEKPV